MQSEIFGPVLPVLEFSELEDIPAQPAALAMYYFGKNRERLKELERRLPSGGVCQNDTMKQMTNIELPFGGVGPSGNGRYRGKWGLEAFTYPKAYTKRFLVKDPFQVLPPYEGAYERLRKLFK
jgi:aldehyde dehydrogenase (NAD+)